MRHSGRARHRREGCQASPIPLEEIRRLMSKLIPGPTYEEMFDPRLLPPEFRRQTEAARNDELDPANLFNITWRTPDGAIRCEVLPKELTGVDANILVLVGRDF